MIMKKLNSIDISFASHSNITFLQPDVAAPGVAIVAASTPEDMGTNEGVAAQSGTSMATPVVAGLVALLRAVHPDWSPAALKSALITTGKLTLFVCCTTSSCAS